MTPTHAQALYIVVDGSLSAGDKMAQAGHAIAAWCIENPELAKEWRTVSEYLIILETPYKNQHDALYNLHRKANELQIGHTGYYEPDLEDDLTAVAFNPGKDTQKLLSNLPLAGRMEKRLETIKDIMRLNPPEDGIYEDEETGVIDMEWSSEHGRAHLQMGETRYAMYVTDDLTLSSARNSRYFKGKMRDLTADWDEIGEVLNSMLYPVETKQLQEA